MELTGFFSDISRRIPAGFPEDSRRIAGGDL